MCALNFVKSLDEVSQLKIRKLTFPHFQKRPRCKVHTEEENHPGFPFKDAERPGSHEPTFRTSDHIDQKVIFIDINQEGRLQLHIKFQLPTVSGAYQTFTTPMLGLIP